MSEPDAKKKKPGKTRVLLVRHGATMLTAEDRWVLMLFLTGKRQLRVTTSSILSAQHCQ